MRTEQLGVRLTPVERDAIALGAAIDGLRPVEWLRRLGVSAAAERIRETAQQDAKGKNNP